MYYFPPIAKTITRGGKTYHATMIWHPSSKFVAERERLSSPYAGLKHVLVEKPYVDRFGDKSKGWFLYVIPE